MGGKGSGAPKMKTPTEKIKTPPDTREQMFVYWCQVDNLAEVARKFNVARSTVNRIYKREGWGARRMKVEAERQNKSDAHVVEKTMSNLELVKNVRRAVAFRLLERFKKRNINPSVRDFVMIMELEEKIAGNLPVNPHEHVINIWNTMPEPERNNFAGDVAKVYEKLRARNRSRMSGNISSDIPSQE